MRIKVAFQKRDRTFAGKLIRFFTRSKYSHVALIIDGYEYSSDFNGVYKIVHKYDEFKWDYVEIDVPNLINIEKFYVMTKNDKYDWFGALGVILPFEQNPYRWHCVEWVCTALKISSVSRVWRYNCSKLSPQKLYEILVTITKGNI